jgi:hypothetical protein
MADLRRLTERQGFYKLSPFTGSSDLLRGLPRAGPLDAKPRPSGPMRSACCVLPKQAGFWTSGPWSVKGLYPVPRPQALPIPAAALALAALVLYKYKYKEQRRPPATATRGRAWC